MSDAPHIPVLLNEVLSAATPVGGVWLDGTLGAGGYTRALLDHGAEHVYGVDRDPRAAREMARWSADYSDRFTFLPGTFGQLDTLAREAGATALDGIVLDIGVSSMQIDEADRGFSFQKDGPLDMRMSDAGPSAADLVNGASEAELADILFQYGEERASRRIAQAIVAARPVADSTLRLAEIVSGVLPRQKPGQPHPATRSFQALRIAVNEELAELARALLAAEQMLRPGGVLIVVTFHSLEDRIVKRFLADRSGKGGGGNRYAPPTDVTPPSFELLNRKAVTASKDELERNPRSRSAKLRAARRTDAAAHPADVKGLGLPRLDLIQLGAGRS
ncbi:16S rRNA (cytosine(1402)-N(4))-methyltransferase RsmH [Pontivivens insulae]|uniref:Ribosomal RNA small subunit methyltransferase H n=1 Tax=Pontivivens insulae TaxID=1639689 RepID=A0A2R8AFI4_9RHOB|nr:16S rRNA (cytosine(1402)-N(4))-methyltransferase RsmH [Pontivivens insulae]RED12246.1 16S rRNA (cytosine1402-N4)-methyltransferase [Pontivivens insulae]SPF31003.1 Ribosomal RNA small subunit methyltransferase H [Pontivivens insulae]